ncbi:MAG TPA: hypothetical protein VHS96_15060 [Bacteroidia bacterium]|nr:hypothetical protein [Bacteroidia bacterium]
MLLLGGFALSCWSQVTNPSGPTALWKPETTFDQTLPGNVVQRIFDAANADDPNMLSGLCDPSFQNDGDTDCICALAPGYSPRTPFPDGKNPLSWDKFKEEFTKGRLNGIPNVRGNGAEVDIYFGKTGARKARILLNRKGSNWYLFSL